MKCRNCNKKIIRIVSLGKLPLGNNFLKKNEIPLEKKYDLSIGFCSNCFLVQLIKTAPSTRLYGKAFYFPSAFESTLKESKEMADYFVKKLNLSSHSSVLDIGCSDGYQLIAFKKFGMKVLGIEPALNSAKIANKRGILTIVDFFNYKLAKKLREKQQFEADLIIGINLLNHIEKINDFLKGVKLLLKPKGIAFFKFFLQRELDIITHEHIFYFSLLSLKNLFKNVDLEIYDVEIKKGALSIFISHSGVFPINKMVKKIIEEEIKKGFNKLEIYQKLAKNIIESKKELTNLLKKLKRRGKIIAAYSASEKGNILLNYCEIGKNYLDFIVDKSELKQGLYTPGTHLLIHSPEKIYQKKPDYLLILSWNIADEIIKQLKDYYSSGGRFIIPRPELQII